MKNKFLSIFVLLMMVSLVNAQVDRSKMPKPGPAPEIKIGDIESFTLDNGLKVFVVENHKLPKVTFRLLVDRDPILEGENAGYVEIAGQLLRTGTKNRTKDQLDEEVDFIGASLFTTSTSVTASALTKHMDKIMDIMADVVLNPNFTQEELDKIKKQKISALASEKDDPNSIAAKMKSQLFFGTDHPYGERVTEKTIESVTLDMCNNYYKTYFKPNISYLAIVGDITLDKAKEMVEKYFSSWEKGEVPSFKYKTPKAPLINKVALVDRPGSVQSVIHVGYPIKLPKNSEDVIPATVMNNLLGGSFSSRLNQNLREKHAFTYGARSVLVSDELIGQFDASLEARNEVTDSSITEILKELKRIRKEKVSEEELEQVKKYMMGSFSRSLENPQTIANFALNIQRYNLPKDFYKNYLKTVEAVTVDDIHKLAKKYIKPNKAYILVVGNGDEVASKLKKFSMSGKVDFYDVDGNKFDPSAKALPEGLSAEDVLNKYLEAIGGKEKIEKITSKISVYKGNVQGMDITVTITQKAPNKYYQMVDAGVFQQKTVFDGEKGFSEAMGQKQPLAGEQLEGMKVQADLHAMLNYDKLGIKAELVGMEKVNGADAYKVTLDTPWGSKWTQYFDVATGFLVRQITPISTPQGSFNQTTDFLDYKDVDGIKYPFKLSQQMGPQSIILTAEKIELNKDISDDLFKVE